MEHSFQQIKEQYAQQREAERKRLTAYLQKHTLFASSGLKVMAGSRSGQGNRDYSSGGRILPFDLSNWKWVECRSQDGGFSAVISLNMPDNDLNSGNPHSLYDQVGVLLTYKHGNDYYKTSIWTDIDLPLDEKAMGKLVWIIAEQFGFYKRIGL